MAKDTKKKKPTAKPKPVADIQSVKAQEIPEVPQTNEQWFNDISDAFSGEWKNEYDIGGVQYRMISGKSSPAQFDLSRKMAARFREFFNNKEVDLNVVATNFPAKDWEDFLTAVLLPVGIDFWTPEIAEHTRQELWKYEKFEDLFLSKVVVGFFMLNIASFYSLRMLQETVQNSDELAEQIVRKTLDKLTDEEAVKQAKLAKDKAKN